jgi:fructosamine-3-kinase
MIPPSVQQEIEANFHLRILSVVPVGGGCIHQTFQLKTDHSDYPSLFLKLNTREKAPLLHAEYEGLQLLLGTQRINVPSLYDFQVGEDYAYLLMEYLPPAFPNPSFWMELATQLVGLHRCTSEFFGLPIDNYIGTLPQRNRPTSSWVEFYVENRLFPLVKMAREKGIFDRGQVQRFERLATRLENLFPEEHPSLLHGDLWNGNIYASKRGAYFLDPAPYYGHREMDLAFSTLFGGFSPLFYQTYQSLYPLEPNFEERKPLYNLYYLLVHLLLFGHGYYSAVMEIVKRWT